ncbi:sensor histidine kinase [Alkalimonas amylolytica]|uniref:histidine kinase n=1 Tax=Alkalimonas amylolytica TaxID=152573 RepID=A0A1H4B1K3_ALKAM|nr:sensor histidine kinase [Alkalimonas amylolytica]SEA41954.1 Two component regulator propeller [Alkalimonas amylolytica]
MNKALTLLLLVFAFIISLNVQANINRIGIDDGLPNTTIFAVVQDELGFIWLGTTDSGLLRFDGYQFIQVPLLTEQEAQQEPFTDVGVLLLDSEQQLWAGTWGQGVSRLDPSRSSLTRFLTDGYQVQSLLEADDGALWVGTTAGLFRIASDDQVSQIGSADSEQPLLHQRVWSLAKGAQGEIWIGTSQGVHRWHASAGLQVGRSLFPEAATSSRQNEARALYFARDKVWVGSRSGLLAFEPDSWQRQVFSVPGEGEYDFPPILNTIYPISSELLVIGSYEGLFQFDVINNSYKFFRQEASLLPSLNIRSVLLDKSGVLWLGTRDGGLYHTRFARSAFSELTLADLPEWQRRYELSVNSLNASQPGILWFGTSERLYRMQLSSGEISSYETSARVNRIVSSPSGQIFIATEAGLFHYLPEQDQIEPYQIPFTSFASSPIIRDMVVLPDSSIWFGLWGQGVLHYHQDSGRTRHFAEDFQRQRANEVVQTLYAMPDGRVWAGTRYNGLYLLDANEGVVQQLNLANNSWLPSNTIQCLNRDAQGVLIVCTNRGTLFWQPDTDSYKVLYASDGLASDHMLGALHWDDRTWLVSAHGLSLISPEFENIVTFTHKDGLSATELNAGAISAAADGSLYLGTLNGLSKAEPEQLWVNQQPPAPMVTAYRINHGELIPLFLHPNQAALQLQPGQNSLELNFSAMDYHDVSRNQYRYRLKGFDERWIYAAERPNAFYSNLPPGRYQFQVMASNNHGLMSDQMDVLQLEILPYWWQQTGYQLLLIVLLLLFALVAHWYRLQHIRQVNRLLKQSIEEKGEAQMLLESKVAERTKALEQSSAALSLRTRQLEKSMQQLSQSNQRLKQLNQIKDEFISTVSHELRTPLTSIRGALSLIDNKIVSPAQASYQELITAALRNSERLSELINDLLDVQKFAAGKMSLRSEHIQLQDLIVDAIAGIAEYAHRFDVAIGFNAEDHVPLVVGDKMRLRQVLDNLLSNAIKFSPPGSEVRVCLKDHGNMLQVTVADLGCGIAESFKARVFEKFAQADASDSKQVQGTGLGLVICKNIIEAHGGEIGFEANQPQGTCFWFRLLVVPTTNKN